MIVNNGRVAVAGPTDMERLIGVMILAFAADPVARWMYRDPQQYLAYFGRFQRRRNRGIQLGQFFDESFA
jgi:hypothetical protein